MALDYNIEPFKEPRGFLKLLQWLFAICAFATTVNFTTDFEFTVKVNCPLTTANGTENKTDTLRVVHTVQYPFALDQLAESQDYPLNKLPNCSHSGQTLNVGFVSNVKSDAQFFVTTGVLSFLYATALVAVYLFADNLYTQNTNMPIIDFVFTLIFAVFWLSGSAAWSSGLGDLKIGGNPWHWTTEATLFSPPDIAILPLTPVKAGVFGGLVISILFGFINFILWATNLWFLYKETTWFESILKQQSTAQPTTSGTA